MNLHGVIIGTTRDNRDGVSRQKLIANMRDDERLYLYDAASDRTPYAVAVLNHDNQVCGF